MSGRKSKKESIYLIIQDGALKIPKQDEKEIKERDFEKTGVEPEIIHVVEEYGSDDVSLWKCLTSAMDAL